MRLRPLHLLVVLASFSQSVYADLATDELAGKLSSHVTSDNRQQLRDELLEAKPFPKRRLVKLLSHSNPAIRNEALEILEEVTGEAYGFVPLRSPKDELNVVALKKWTTWASGKVSLEKKKRELSKEDAQRYISDIISEKRDGYAKAVRRLEPYHLVAVGKIQEFIDATPHLTDGATAKLKQAQYELVLGRSSVGDPATVARELTFGSRDQRLAALNSLKGAGLVSIPILRQYLTSSDALVRETAVDAIIDVGGRQVLDLVTPVLKAERDANVVHVALRRLKNIKSEESINLVKTFLEHSDEDIIISSLKVYTDLKGGNRYSFSSSNSAPKPASDVDKIVIKMLDDKRWRIRSAALEYIEKSKLKIAEDKVITLLRDEDDFVQSTAIKAAVALRSSKALPELEAILTESDDMDSIVIQGLISMQPELSKKQVSLIESKGADAMISLISQYTTTKPFHIKALIKYAKHPNIDVVCAALRTLSNERDRVEYKGAADVLAEALGSGSKEKIEAVLGSLELPKNPFLKNSLGSRFLQVQAEGGNQELNDLYKAFGEISKVNLEAREVQQDTSNSGMGALITKLRQFSKDASDKERQMRCIILLAGYGDVNTLKELSTKIEDLPPSQRIAIAESLRNTKSEFGLVALQALVDDNSAEIRRLAIHAFFYEDSNKALVAKGLEAIAQEDAKVKAKEIYGSKIEYAARSRHSRRVVGKWCREVLASDKSKLDIKVLALVLLRSTYVSSDRELVEKLTKSDSAIIRRAAWFTFAHNEPSALLKYAGDILNDRSILVRKAIPMALNKKSASGWMHYFTEVDAIEDEYYDYNSGKKPLAPEAEELLFKIVESETSDQVRYEALFTLLCYQRDVNLDIFLKLFSELPASSKAEKRLRDYIVSNYAKMGRGLAPLISYIDTRSVTPKTMDEIVRHFYGEESKLAFASFEGLAEAAEKVEAAPQHIEVSKEELEAIAKRESIRLIYFYEKTCSECKRVDGVISKFKEEFEENSNLKLIIDRVDINDREGGIYNRVIAGKEGKGKGKKPAIYSQLGAIFETDIKAASLGQLVSRVSDSVPDDSWYKISEEEKVEAKVELKEEYESLTLPIVIFAGLIDGVNPCAFATIIFFLSYLQVAKRSPKEIFFVGCAFILGVFIAYFSIGLVLHSVIGALSDTLGATKTVLNYIFAFFALLVAFFSFKDYLKARQGKLSEMSLQLPNALKGKIRKVIRSGSKSSLYVLAAFVTGVVISFLELACTGQAYAPIIYQIQQGNHDAVAYLFIFNVAFILPLIIIFGLAMTGMTSQSLIKFQQKHTAKVKLAFTLLFILLALTLIFNDQVAELFHNAKELVGLGSSETV